MGNRSNKEPRVQVHRTANYNHQRIQFQKLAINNLARGIWLATQRGDKEAETVAYICLGRVHEESNQIRTAIQHYEKALEIATQQEDKLNETSSYIRLGQAYRKNNQIQKAIEYHERALKIAKEREDKQGETAAYIGLGLAHRNSNRIQMAIEYFEKGLQIARQREDKLYEAQAYIGLGHAHRKNNQIQTAMEYYERALKIAKEKEDEQTETIAYICLGHAHAESNQTQTATEHCEKVLEIATQREAKLNETNSCKRLEYAYININQLQIVIDYYKRALKIAKERKDKQNETVAYIWSGCAYEKSNQIQMAIEFFKKGLKIARKREDKLYETEAYNGLGHAYRKNNQIQTAMEYHGKALEIAKEQDDEENETVAYIGLGHSNEEDNRIQTAIESYEKALNIARQRNDKQNEILACIRLGDAHKENNEITTAIEYYKTALGIAKDKKETKWETVAQNSIKAISDTQASSEQNNEEIQQKNSWFKDTFLDCKRNLKEEIHEELKSFPWFCGSYGVTGPNKKIPHLHLFLTVKRGTKKSDVRRELEETFKCGAKEYFELLQEPKRKPKVKYLADRNDETPVSSSSPPSTLPTPGGGVLACVDKKYTVRNPMRVPEENERGDTPEVLAIGTLTMFSVKDGQHYALTCLHVGSANDGDSFSDYSEENKAKKSSSQLSAMTKTYLFAENNEENNNAAISFGNDERNYVPLGNFYKCHSDSECDILSLKIPVEIEVSCRVVDVSSPNWASTWDELLENAESLCTQKIKVEKTGFASALTRGHIVSCHASYKDLFKNAVAVKGCDGPFLENGDSGALVFFHDKNDKKQVFAYGVCEVDELCLPEQQGPRSSDDSDSDGSSIWSADDSSCGSKDDTLEYDEVEDKCAEQKVGDAESESGDKNEHAKDENDKADDASDVEIVFQNATGPYYICLRLDTALEKLGLHETACINDCGNEG